MWGSSPPVRGALSQSSPLHIVGGLIPACAGSTNSHKHILSSKRAHPRLCGEHSPIFQGALTTVGSSPLARGTLQSRIFRFSRRGLIPARAGNTACYLWASGWTGAHPRSRGEHMGFPSVPSLDMGSSPPVRGALSRVHGNDPAAGLIPACAGSTCCVPTVRRTRWAHPRLCGEHANEQAGKRTLLGSSPPVRGARLWLRPGHHLQGLIPACAGSTTLQLAPASRSWAHPRLCGEH